MSIHSNISAIQARMREIQSKFGGNTAPFTGVYGLEKIGPPKADRGIIPSSSQGITFEELLATKMKDTEGRTQAAGDVKSSNYSGKPTEFDGIIREASQKYGVEERFVKCIIQQESAFDPNATSWVGAMGLMQLMPETARELGVKNAYDPHENVMGGVKYIKEQLDRFGGDKRKALAAYNAGPGAVMKHGGIPPYQETQNYVKNIMSHYISLGGKE
jgi:soluble lytic murein transglycosylase-like protein